MTDLMIPFTVQLDHASGALENPAAVTRRRLSDMQGLYADSEAEQALAASDPLVYSVYLAAEVPAHEGQLGYSTTVIEPGRVGDEYFMTKGHYHARGDRAEVYIGLRGEGYLLLQAPDGRVDAQPMKAGSASYVPPYWGHRTINSGTEPFAFWAVYPADAGYDYGPIAERGFASLLVARDGRPTLVPNPRFGRQAE